MNINILALIGGPRKGGNTEILVDQILKGCRKNGHTGEKVYLYDYEIMPVWKRMVTILFISQVLTLNVYPKQEDISSFVVVSLRDPRYFELSNGSSYIPIGFNLVGPPREDEFDRLFKIMASHGKHQRLGTYHQEPGSALDCPNRDDKLSCTVLHRDR